jgi:hypothetical protein
MQFAENRALLSGELDWKRYLKPRERAEFSAFEEYLAECKRIDEFNRSTWEYNNSTNPVWTSPAGRAPSGFAGGLTSGLAGGGVSRAMRSLVSGEWGVCKQGCTLSHAE